MKTGRYTNEGFTRIDALALFSLTILILGGAVAASARTAHSRSILTCINNLKQLTRAWTHYAEDNVGTLVAAGSYNVDEVAAGTRPPEWTGGQFLDSIAANDLDHIDPRNGTSPLSGSPLWKYTSSPTIFQCPDDYVHVSHESLGEGVRVQRVRSYSMQSWMGGPTWQSGSWITFTNLANFSKHAPSEAMVFIEERPELINDGYFVVDMSGFEPGGNPARNRNARLVDVPASNHRAGLHGRERQTVGVAGFADGRADTRVWADPRTREKIAGSSPGNTDVYWLQRHATSMQ